MSSTLYMYVCVGKGDCMLPCQSFPCPGLYGKWNAQQWHVFGGWFERGGEDSNPPIDDHKEPHLQHSFSDKLKSSFLLLELPPFKTSNLTINISSWTFVKILVNSNILRVALWVAFRSLGGFLWQHKYTQTLFQYFNAVTFIFSAS